MTPEADRVCRRGHAAVQFLCIVILVVAAAIAVVAGA